MDDINVNMLNCTTSLTFMGVVPSINKLPTEANIGDVYMCSDTQDVYLWSNKEWYMIGNGDSIDEKDPKPAKMIPFPEKCKYCGASLHDYICEYCGTEYPKYAVEE